MEIIKRGTDPRESIWVGNCGNCGSIMEAQQSELKIDSCPREHYKFAHDQCPVCDNGIIFYPRPPKSLNG